MSDGEGTQQPAEEVDVEGDEEQVSSAPLIGQPTEEQRTGHLTEQIDGSDGECDFGSGKVQRLLTADEAGDVAPIVISVRRAPRRRQAR